MRKQLLILLIISLCVCCLSATALGFDFGLSKNTFIPVPGSQQNLILTNSGADFVALEISMLTRQHDINGKEYNEDADDDFLIYPSQILLPAGEEQVVSIRWAGEGSITAEKAYRLVIEELPISSGQKIETEISDQSKATLKVLRRFLKSIYVTPEVTKPDLQLISAVPTFNTENKNAVELTFYNRGNIHIILKDTKIIVKPEGASSSVYSEPYKPDVFNAVNILASSKQKVIIPWPENVPYGAVSVRLSSGK
ncbi:MAG: hypothetical protein ABIH39_07075 [Candidatus Margulisiibacteriota bacterium]